jgi:hypothetical protein
MKMLARAPTKWFRTGFAVCLFLSVFVLTKPLTAEAGCHNASCGCRDWGIDSCKDSVCWYADWDHKCDGHSWYKDWDTAGDCENPAQIKAYCGICGLRVVFNYPKRNHSWGAWTDYDANNHIRYCQNTKPDQRTDPLGNIVTIYKACSKYETQAHSWSSWVDFNPDYYRNQYRDLWGYGNNCSALWNHWYYHGQYEGRVSADGEYHTRWCWTCQRLEKQKHDWTDWQDNGDGRHVRKCKVCGRTEYGEHTYGDIKMESNQSSTHDKTVTYSFGCTTCPRVEHVKLTLHVSEVKEKGTESSRYKKSGQCPVSESAEYYTGTGTAEFWSGKNESTDNKIVSQSVTVDEKTGDRTSKNASDKASGDSNTFTWNKDEGIKYFRYTVTDARGHTYSIATDYSYLLDHTPPQISVSVNLPGWVSGSRTNSMAWTENAATVKGRSSDSGESAWSNKENPTIMINCTTRNLDDSSEAYDHMKEIRLYKKVKEPSGIETIALLKVWKNTRSAVYTIPKGREDVEKNIDGSENLYGEGTGTYYVVAIDDLNRRAISNDSCPELIDTKSVYNELAKNNDYDYGLQADFGYDVNHVTVTPLTVHLDYMPPKIKDLTGNNSDNSSDKRIVNSVLQYRMSDNNDGRDGEEVNDNSDLSSITIYGYTSDKQKHTIASYSRNWDDPFQITMPNNIGAFTLSGEGANWIGGSDTKTLSPGQILSLSFQNDPCVISRQTSTLGDIVLDCSRTPGLSNIQYESYSIEVMDRAGNKGFANHIRTTQSLTNTLHTTIDRSSYK